AKVAARYGAARANARTRSERIPPTMATVSTFATCTGEPDLWKYGASFRGAEQLAPSWKATTSSRRNTEPMASTAAATAVAARTLPTSDHSANNARLRTAVSPHITVGRARATLS